MKEFIMEMESRNLKIYKKFNALIPRALITTRQASGDLWQSEKFKKRNAFGKSCGCLERII